MDTPASQSPHTSFTRLAQFLPRSGFRAILGTAGLLAATLGRLGAADAPAATAAPAASAVPVASAAPAEASASASASGRRGRGTAAARGSAATRGTAPAAPAALEAWPRPAEGKPLFVEDFESGTLNDKIWSLHAAGNATIKVASDKSAHGKDALWVHYPKGTTSREWAFVGVQVPEALRDHYYGRAYVYINAMPTGHCVLLLSGTTGFPIADFLEIGLRQNQFQPSFQLNKPVDGRPRGETTSLQGAPPTGRWFCLEWEFNDKPDRITIWIDGTLTVNKAIAHPVAGRGTPAVNTGLTGGFNELVLGFRSWSTAPNDVDIYYDDIAIGDKPIGQLAPPSAAAPAANDKPAEAKAAN